MSEYPPDEVAAPKASPDADKPLEQRLVSKTWSLRKDAFEELRNAFKSLPENSSNDQISEHASKWATYLMEPNPGALEKVLDCFQEFIRKCEPGLLSSIQVSLFKPMIEKQLGHAKASLKAKSLDCMLLFFEFSENFEEDTMDTLLNFCKSTKQKVS